MNNIVLYESKYGSTQRYANWIGEELNCKVLKISDTNIDELTNYDNIIFGGWVHAGKLNGFNKIYENIDKLRDKKLLVFAVGLAMTEDPDYQNYKAKTFNKFNNLKHFYLRGAFDFNKLNFSDKIMMNVFKTILKMKNAKESNEKITAMLNSYSQAVDFTKRENIKIIVDEVKESSL